MQRDQAAHFHASNKQVADELVESQAQLSQQAGRLSKEGERRRHLEALLDEGLQVQNQILLGLQVHHTRIVDLTYNTLSNWVFGSCIHNQSLLSLSQDNTFSQDDTFTIVVLILLLCYSLLARLGSC